MDRESICSVRLSWLLDNIIGTEEEVSMRRKLASMLIYIGDVNNVHTVLFSGSRGEGLEFESSDTDLMYVLKEAVVLKSVHGKESADPTNTKAVFLIRREGCSPGFVLLQYHSSTGLSINMHDVIRKSIVNYHGIDVVSSALVRDEWVSFQRSNGSHAEIHGPCATERFGVAEVDHALCFACITWPSEALDFIHRYRPYDWPNKDLIEKIVQNGCHLVAIGDPNSEISYLQWRLSFSAAEKMLVHSFNHTQLKVYGLMKIFLKQAINTRDSVRDLLCSYFLKTVVFYSIETTPESFWTEDLLISCFWFCFNKLIAWVEEGNCPNYFVPENNMFRSKVYGERRENLLCVLNEYKLLGWTCLCQCRDLKPLKAIVRRPQIGAEHQLADERKREMLLDKIIFKGFNLSTAFCFLDRKLMSRFIGKSLQVLAHSRSRDEEDIALYSLCIAFKETVKLHTSNLYSGTSVTCNKSKYLQIRKCRNFLSMSTILDLSNRYLTDATFFYTVGNYKKSLQICEQMSSRWSHYVAYDGTLLQEVPRAYLDRVCGQNLSIRNKVMTASAFDVKIHKEWKVFYPKELHHDIQAQPNRVPLLIPPLPYMAFLMFLCNHHLGNIDSSVSALHELRTLIDDYYQGRERYHVVFNLLAICLHKIGDVRGAIKACQISLMQEPHTNGATKLLDELKGEARL